MKRSDFIPDDRLKDLIQFVADAPDAIKLAADNAWDCNRVEIDNVEQRINDIKAETEWDVKTAKTEDDKLVFSNEKKRKDEVRDRLLADTNYQNRLEEKHRLETERNQKFTIMYEAKNVFKSVCKQLDVVVALQDSENLVMELGITNIINERIQRAKEAG